MTILFLHGWGGKRTHYWMPWLETELTKLGHTIYAPQIPNSYNPKKDKWVKHIKEYVEAFKPDAVVAHSIGALAWWHFQSLNHYPIKAQLFVAPPTHASFAKIESFFPLPTQFNSFAAHVIATKTDTNIDIPQLSRLCRQERFELTLLDEGGHLDPYSKILRLDEALNYFV